MGTSKLYDKGGSFNFKVSYISQGGLESELSQPFFVQVKARPLSNPSLQAKAKPLKAVVAKKVQEKYETKKKEEEIKKKMAADLAAAHKNSKP